jgi:hypothetical protein
MLKKTITYTDYNDVVRTEDFYFNLSKAEILEMELTAAGGYSNMIQKIVDAQDFPTIVELWKELILKAYGEKSADGKRFIKNDEIRDAFMQTEAYSILFMELSLDADAGANFVNGIIPANWDAEKAALTAKVMAKTAE